MVDIDLPMTCCPEQADHGLAVTSHCGTRRRRVPCPNGTLGNSGLARRRDQVCCYDLHGGLWQHSQLQFLSCENMAQMVSAVGLAPGCCYTQVEPARCLPTYAIIGAHALRYHPYRSPDETRIRPGPVAERRSALNPAAE